MGVERLKWYCIKSLFDTDTGIHIRSFISSFIRSFIPQLPGLATRIQLATPSHPPIRFPPETPQWLHQAVQGLDKGRHLQCCPGSVLQFWIRTGIFWQTPTIFKQKRLDANKLQPLIATYCPKENRNERLWFFFRILKLRFYQLGHQNSCPMPHLITPPECSLRPKLWLKCASHVQL